MFLALDAGGTSSRAVVLDASGRAYGYGRAGSGNPTATGIRDAVNAIGVAAEQALAGATGPRRPASALVAMAGEKTPKFRQQVSDRLAALGVRRVVLEHDLLGIFHSGTAALDGYALIAGTGTVAARIRGGRLDRVVGGRGWLLGDAGGGFWIGHAVARAAVASLDGQGQDTALTRLFLEAMRIAADTTTVAGRAEAVRQLVSVLYARPPISLAEFAPLAFAAHEDQLARSILVGASAALADLLSAVRTPDVPGPVVVGGSIIVHGMMAAPPSLQAELVPPIRDNPMIPVSDGLVGAAVLVLRHAGREVGEGLLQTIQAEVARVIAAQA
ncbi:MAG TPA: BadF/BadG/BcrA/BcrD ATPase family protein [Propionibacteriaceae bacterium]|nr:BadF/BadG/BcrA/BcrD ATPase family protein [Propionibacteriaceae bacterium]